MTASERQDHLIDLPGGDWKLWKWFAVRGAGFPVAGLAWTGCHRATHELSAVIEKEQDRRKARRDALAVLVELLKTESGATADALERTRRSLQRGQLPKTFNLPTRAAVAVEAYRQARVRHEQKLKDFGEAWRADQLCTSQILRRIAADPRFREAVVWQNPDALKNNVDSLLKTAPDASDGKTRKRERLVAKYWQRYCAKNDTIGFFGPVGWGSWVPEPEAVQVVSGDPFLSSREVHFETWCIRAFAAFVFRDPAARACLAPRLHPSIRREANELHLETTPDTSWNITRLTLSDEVADLLSLCDGKRSAREIAALSIRDSGSGGSDEADVFEALEGLSRKKILIWEPEIPISYRSEAYLMKLIEKIDDAGLRNAAVEKSRALEQLRSEIQRSAGTVDSVELAMEQLGRHFEETTDVNASRNHGHMYAARTLVFEDCVRNLEVRFGADLRDRLAAPLSLLLTSARWLSYEMGRRTEVVGRKTLGRLAAASGAGVPVPFSGFYLATRKEFRSARDETLSEFSSRWKRLLGSSAEEHMVRHRSEDLRQRVMEEFSAPHPGWRLARYHSPDLMIAATSMEAVQKGDYEIVLGELHPTLNTLAQSVFIENHPGKEDLVRAWESDSVGPKPNFSFLSTSRTHFALRGSSDFLVENQVLPSPYPVTLPVSQFAVHDTPDGLVVATRDGRVVVPLMEMLGLESSYHIAKKFRLVPSEKHTPRIYLDDVVIQRESWAFSPAELSFAGERDSEKGFAAVQEWARTHGIPEQFFAKVPSEEKPVYVDRTSTIFTSLFLRSVLKSAEEDTGDKITVSEMLPTRDQAWLPDKNGNRYTSEFRTVVLDPRTPPRSVKLS